MARGGYSSIDDLTPHGGYSIDGVTPHLAGLAHAADDPAFSGQPRREVNVCPVHATEPLLSDAVDRDTHVRRQTGGETWSLNVEIPFIQGTLHIGYDLPTPVEDDLFHRFTVATTKRSELSLAKPNGLAPRTFSSFHINIERKAAK